MFFLAIFPLIILCTVFILLGCQPEKERIFRFSEYMHENRTVTVLQTLANENLSVKIHLIMKKR
jgi:hypothetical protein